MGVSEGLVVVGEGWRERLVYLSLNDILYLHIFRIHARLLHLETLSPASNLSLKRMCVCVCVCVCVCLCVHACLGARRVHSSHQAALAPREAANETHRLAGGCLWQVDFGREWLFLEKTQRDEEEAEE